MLDQDRPKLNLPNINVDHPLTIHS